MRPILVFALVLGVAAPARAQTLDRAFAALRNSVSAVSSRQTDRITAIRSRIDQLESGALSLPQTERADYAVSLLGQAQALDAAASERNQARARAMIAQVEADLAIKADARAFGSANSLRGQVLVVARTRRGRSEVHGLVIGVNPIARAGSPNFMFRFPQMSSPTSRPLPPGRYMFVLMRGNSVISREQADVGTTSLQQIDLDLSVPAERRRR